VYNHKQIRRFAEYGEILDDRYFANTRQTVLRFLVEHMRELGYVRRLDIDDDFTLEFSGENYSFKLSVYGVYIGKRRSQFIEGMLGTQPIMRSSKSETPSSSLV